MVAPYFLSSLSKQANYCALQIPQHSHKWAVVLMNAILLFAGSGFVNDLCSMCIFMPLHSHRNDSC